MSHHQKDRPEDVARTRYLQDGSLYSGPPLVKPEAPDYPSAEPAVAVPDDPAAIRTETISAAVYLADPGAANELAERVGYVRVVDTDGKLKLGISSNRASERGLDDEPAQPTRSPLLEAYLALEAAIVALRKVTEDDDAVDMARRTINVLEFRQNYIGAKMSEFDYAWLAARGK